MKHWNKPRALLAALGGATSAAPRRPSAGGNRTQAGVGSAWQQAPACDWVFMIDADAAVRTLSVGLQQLLGLARILPRLTRTPTLTPALALTLTRCATSAWGCNRC